TPGRRPRLQHPRQARRQLAHPGRRPPQRRRHARSVAVLTLRSLVVTLPSQFERPVPHAVPRPETVVDLPPALPERGRSADISSAWRDGRSTTVLVLTWTMVDPPPTLRSSMVAERPPSTRSARRWVSGHRRPDRPDGGRSTTATRRRDVGGSTTVWASEGQIDHRLGELGADRPPSGREGGRIDHRL